MPQVTTYNVADLPFVYPPLGLYVAALVGELLGLSSLDGVRLVAALLSLATAAAVVARVAAAIPVGYSPYTDPAHSMVADQLAAGHGFSARVGRASRGSR